MLTDQRPLPVGAIISTARADLARAAHNASEEGYPGNYKAYAFMRGDVYKAADAIEILERAYNRAAYPNERAVPLKKPSALILYSFPGQLRAALMLARKGRDAKPAT